MVRPLDLGTRNCQLDFWGDLIPVSEYSLIQICVISDVALVLFCFAINIQWVSIHDFSDEPDFNIVYRFYIAK